MKLLLKIFYKKFTFKPIKKIDLLIFGHDKFKFNKNIKYTYYKNSEINLRYIFPVLILYLKQFFIKKITIIDAYFLVILNLYNCKIALGNDREQGVFRFKKLFPNKISVAYQFGYWFEELIELGKIVIKDQSTDYYFMFDERTKKLTENLVKSNYFVTGSVSSNEKIFNGIKKKYDFMFISNFRKKIKTQSKNLIERTINVTGSKNLMECSAFMLTALSNYCNQSKKTFCIARVSTRVDKKKYSKSLKNEENNFLKENAKNFILEEVDSFELAQQSEVSICTHSNLGYQLLARGSKVLFLNTDKDVYNWHFISSSSGPFWYKGSNLSEIYKKLDDILKMSKNDWNKVVTDSLVPMKFDPGNTVLKNLISEIITKVSDNEVRH